MARVHHVEWKNSCRTVLWFVEGVRLLCNLVPRSPHFLLFGLRSVQCMEVEEREKQRSPGNTYDVMTSGEHEVNVGGRSPHSNNVLDFIIEHSNDSQDPRCSRDRQYSILRLENHSMVYYTWICSWAPHVIDVIGVPSCFSCSSAKQTEKQKKKWQRPGNEANYYAHVTLPFIMYIHTTSTQRSSKRTLNRYEKQLQKKKQQKQLTKTVHAVSISVEGRHMPL